MIRLELLLWAVLCPALAGGFQFPVNPLAPQPPGPLRTVTGTVVNGITGEPIRRALVRLNGAASASALTGADGRFQFEDIPEGPIALFPQKPGYFDSRSAVGNPLSPGAFGFTVGPGKNDFRVPLFPAARIIGTVSDTNADAIEFAQVSVLLEQIVDGRKQWQNRGTSLTDDDGSFRIDDLVSGRYIIFFAGHAANARNSDGSWDVWPPAYYPDGADLASAQPIELQPGEISRTDFRAHMQHGFSIRGTVTGMTGALMGGLSLWGSSSQSIQVGGTHFDQTKGDFAIDGVPTGRWTLSYETNDNQGHRYLAKREIAVGHTDISNLQVALFPAASIPVTVTHAASSDQSPNPQQPVTPSFYGTLISQDSLNPTQIGITNQGDPPQPRFENVAPGKYRLRIQTGGECVESAWYGSIDLLNDYLVIAEGAGGNQPITVNMQSACATINIHVQAKDRQQSGVVLVIPANPIQETFVLPWVGEIQWSPPLPAGSYQLYNLSNISGLEYANPEVMRGYPSQSVTLTAGQKADVTLEVTERKGN